LEEAQWTGTALLAEDEEMLRWTLKTTLTRMGFSVLDAKDVIEAMRCFAGTRTRSVWPCAT
jgi:DNA-binding response OmpR family regulator